MVLVCTWYVVVRKLAVRRSARRAGAGVEDDHVGCRRAYAGRWVLAAVEAVRLADTLVKSVVAHLVEMGMAAQNVFRRCFSDKFGQGLVTRVRPGQRGASRGFVMQQEPGWRKMFTEQKLAVGPVRRAAYHQAFPGMRANDPMILVDGDLVVAAQRLQPMLMSGKLLQERNVVLIDTEVRHDHWRA